MENTDDSQTAGSAVSLHLRPEQPSDEPWLFTVYAGSREAELRLTDWDAATRQAFLEMQFKAMRQGYRNMYPQAQFSIIVADNTPAGRFVVDRQDALIQVVDIALLPTYCGRGIGTAVMRALLSEADQGGKKVRLCVRRESRALRFYERLGFERVGDNGLDLELEREPLKPA
jgi:ribosomal protein S18 acetylase RimI-like enzyme